MTKTEGREARELLAAEYAGEQMDVVAGTTPNGFMSRRDAAALRAIEAALTRSSDGPGAREVDLTVSEKLKLDIGAAMMEERNPGLDDYAGAFNQGISAARVAAFKVIDRGKLGDG